MKRFGWLLYWVGVFGAAVLSTVDAVRIGGWYIVFGSASMMVFSIYAVVLEIQAVLG